MSLLKVEGLSVCFKTRKGILRAVNDASFSVEEGETLAIVGESGSGKSVTATSILRLLGENGYIDGGRVLFEGMDLTKISDAEMRRVRGNRISMIFQEPMTALNPVLTVGRQLCEPFLIHGGMDKKQAKRESLKMLEIVGIPSPERIFKDYPHRLSGGMRQRVMIAMALACKPRLLIADEPTTALDVTVQAQILSLMKELQSQTGTAILFITHDLGVVNEIADGVAVTYCGQIVDRARRASLFGKGKYSHPYTEGLLRSIPTETLVGGELPYIDGSVPSPFELPKGCKFSPRCPYCTERCVREEPPLFEFRGGRDIRCFYADKEERTSAEHAKIIIR